MTEGNNFFLDLIAYLHEARSIAQINNDMKRIQKQLNKLELKAVVDPDSITAIQKKLSKIAIKAELSPDAVQNLVKQLEAIANKHSINISSINVGQGQAEKAGQEMGRKVGEGLKSSLASSLNAVRQNIYNLFKEFDTHKLNSYDLSKMFNLNRSEIDSSVIKQVRGLTKELNALAKDVLKTDSDSAWEGVIQKISALSNVLNEYGKARDTSSFKESLDILEHFKGQKIFVGDKSEVLQNTGMSVRELNNQFRNLGITFTTVAKNATHLDTIWSELFNISPGLEKFTTFGDQISALVDHFKIAKEALYGESNLQPLQGKEATNVLMGWLANLEEVSKKMAVLRGEQAEIEQMGVQQASHLADTVVQNEGKKQEAYRQTAEAQRANVESMEKELAALERFRTDTLPKVKGNLTDGFYADQVQQQIEKYNRLGLELPNVRARIEELKAAEQELKAVMNDGNATIEQQKAAYDSFQQSLKNANASNSISNSMYMAQGSVDGLIAKLQAFLQKNTSLSGTVRAEINGWIEKLQQADTVYKSLGNDAVAALKRINTEQGKVGKTSGSMFQSLKQNMSFLSYWTSSAYLTMQAIAKVRQAFGELKEVNTILTEISKTSDLTTRQIEKLGKASFGTASKYGREASDYLTGVQEMYRAGYKNAEELAELSTLAQSSGDLDADLANDYIIASDAAYGYAGNIEKLNALLDSQNQVTNRNAVSMEELARATKVAANQLANSNISENEMTALLGTGIATSREAGETVGRAIKGIVMNLQQVEGETGFDGEILDEESLKKVEARCHSVGVELEYMKDGIVRLRDPMTVLKELSEVYNSLPDDSADKAGIIADIGGKYRGNVLSSILSNWDKVEKMLGDYENATGSAMNEAMKSANNWEGSLNRLKNTWTETVGNIADSDAIITIINGTNSLLDVLNKLTSKLGSIGTIGLGAFAFLNKGRSNTILPIMVVMPCCKF